MDEIKLACPSSDECGLQEVTTKMDPLLDLRKQIIQLLCTSLSDSSIRVMQEELQLRQRSSYYLEIQRDDLLPTTDENILHLSDSTVWSLMDQRKLQRAMSLANIHVKFLLTFQGMLYEEIITGSHELWTFIMKYDQGLVESDMAAATQQRLQQIHQYEKNFKSSMTRNLGPLDLQNQLTPNTGNFPIQQLSASVALKRPVIFNRSESCTTSNTVHLCWQVAEEQSKELNQQFEIHVNSLHPNNAELDKPPYSTLSYNLQVSNLIPDSYYRFSVKRVDVVNLVYGLWIDTIILKTEAFSK